MDVGYTLHERLINSIEYGAPQDRERIILLGFQSKRLAKSFNWSGRLYPDRNAFSYSWPTTNEFSEDSTLAMPESLPQELTVDYWFKKNNVSEHVNAKHVFTARSWISTLQGCCRR
jgi:DNA (cytosine-5)-methyltransferase 1